VVDARGLPKVSARKSNNFDSTNHHIWEFADPASPIPNTLSSGASLILGNSPAQVRSYSKIALIDYLAVLRVIKG